MLTWTSAPLDADLDVVGDIELELARDATAIDTAWIVTLQDVAPDGTVVDVTAGWLRASLARSTTAASRPARRCCRAGEADAVPPANDVAYRIPLVANARRFAAGHRIRVVVSPATTRSRHAGDHGLPARHRRDEQPQHHRLLLDGCSCLSSADRRPDASGVVLGSHHRTVAEVSAVSTEPKVPGEGSAGKGDQRPYSQPVAPGHRGLVRLTNVVVSFLLRSPFHRLLSGKVDIVRYRGARTGREVSTPTQYVRRGNDIVILVGRPETKTWWRNFRQDHDIDLLLQGRWVAANGRAILGAEEPDTARSLLAVYLKQFPTAMRDSDGATVEERARQAVFVLCQPKVTGRGAT